MAGFRRLCGRICCVGGRMSRNLAEGAKFKRLRRLWGHCVALVVWSAEHHGTRLCTREGEFGIGSV